MFSSEKVSPNEAVRVVPGCRPGCSHIVLPSGYTVGHAMQEHIDAATLLDAVVKPLPEEKSSPDPKKRHPSCCLVKTDALDRTEKTIAVQVHPIHVAALVGNLSAIKKTFSQKREGHDNDEDETNKNNKNVDDLFKAAASEDRRVDEFAGRSNNIELLKYLHEVVKLDINHQNTLGWNNLLIASFFKESLPIVKLLLELNYDPNPVTPEKRENALMWALAADNMEAAAALTTHGANLKNANSFLAMEMLIIRNNRLAALKLLVENKDSGFSFSDWNWRDENKLHPLTVATLAADHDVAFEAFEFVLKHVPYDDKFWAQQQDQQQEQDNKNFNFMITTPPLTSAARLGHVKIVRKLLTSLGADVNRQTFAHGPPILAACTPIGIDCVPILLAHGANADDIVESTGVRLLVRALVWDCKILPKVHRMIVDLLKAGASPNQQVRHHGGGSGRSSSKVVVDEPTCCTQNITLPSFLALIDFGARLSIPDMTTRNRLSSAGTEEGLYQTALMQTRILSMRYLESCGLESLPLATSEANYLISWCKVVVAARHARLSHEKGQAQEKEKRATDYGTEMRFWGAMKHYHTFTNSSLLTRFLASPTAANSVSGSGFVRFCQERAATAVVAWVHQMGFLLNRSRW